MTFSTFTDNLRHIERKYDIVYFRLDLVSCDNTTQL